MEPISAGANASIRAVKRFTRRGRATCAARLTITPKGKACFADEDDNYASLSCFVMRRTPKGFRFEGDFGANFTTNQG